MCVSITGTYGPQNLRITSYKKLVEKARLWWECGERKKKCGVFIRGNIFNSQKMNKPGTGWEGGKTLKKDKIVEFKW